MTKPIRATGRALIKAPQETVGARQVRQLPELVTAEVVMNGREGIEDRVRRAYPARQVCVCSEPNRAGAAYLALTESLDSHLSQARPLQGGFMDMVESVMRGSDRKSTVSIEM